MLSINLITDVLALNHFPILFQQFCKTTKIDTDIGIFEITLNFYTSIKVAYRENSKKCVQHSLNL